MRMLFNAAVAVLMMGTALGIAWVLRPTSVATWPTYTPTPHAVPYDTMTWTPEPPSLRLP